MEWNIKKSKESCVRCDSEIEEGAYYYSLLEVNGEEIIRVDLCGDCFEKERESPKEVFWRTRKIAPENHKKAVNFEILREIFLKMLDAEEEGFKEICYLLSLILVRKRFLLLKDFVSENGKEYVAVRQNKGAPLLKVEIPLISQEQIGRLKDRLADLLDADLDSDTDIMELKKKVCSAEPPADTAGEVPAEQA